MADALGVSPETLRRIAEGLALAARSGVIAEQFAQQVRHGYKRISVPAPEAFAAFRAYRSKSSTTIVSGRSTGANSSTAPKR